jgi:hypothetical protein
LRPDGRAPDHRRVHALRRLIDRLFAPGDPRRISGLRRPDPWGIREPLDTWLAAPGREWARQVDTFVRFVWPIGLALWFAWNSWQRITFFLDRTFPVGIDAKIYYRGAWAWVHGGDPWEAGVNVLGTTFHYAGTPVTTVVYAPFTVLPEEVFTLLAFLAGMVAGGYIVWRLGLDWYWMLFPPLVEGLFSANPQILVVALLLLAWGPASALATMLKVYAFVPLFGEGRWWHIVLAVVANAATILLATDLWRAWLGNSDVINNRLLREAFGGFSAFGHWPLFAALVVALLLLALRDRRASGWLAVPALWPATQFHYQTMVMPTMTPLLAVLLAYPTFDIPAPAILADVLIRLVAPLAVPWLLLGRRPTVPARMFTRRTNGT